MSVSNVCKDRLQSCIKQVLMVADCAQRALNEGDYERCAQWLEECEKYCSFDITLVEVFRALTDENKAETVTK